MKKWSELRVLLKKCSEKLYRLRKVSGNAPMTPSCVFVLLYACLFGFYLLFSITVSCECTCVLSKFRARKTTKPCWLLILESPMNLLSWVLVPRYKRLKSRDSRKSPVSCDLYSLEKLTPLVRTQSSERVDDGS